MPATLSLRKTGEQGAAPPWTRAEAWGLALVLALAAALRAWHLDRNGFGNAYYAAAVRSMLRSPHNFFFVSFDPGGWVTVDKPPLALWIQAVSAKLFGYSGASLLLPQAMEGVAGVALLHALVRRAFDRTAALCAALVLALMPLSVAVDRYNNVDACLVFVLLLAAWAISRAVESGRRSQLLAAAVLSGLAFNTKMLMGFIFLPAFYATYLFGAPGTLRHRIKELALASAVLALVSLSWILAVDWTPAAQRPFVGSSTGNSMVELSFMGWNGLQRFSRHRPATKPDAAALSAGSGAGSGNAASGEKTGPEPVRAGHRGGPWGGGSPPGPFRLAAPEWAAQVLWFIPMALLGLFAALRRGPRLRAPTISRQEVPAPSWNLLRAIAGAPGLLRQSLLSRPDRQALFFWAAWLAIHALVFSSFSVVHTYYLVLLAPAVAALTGIGLRALWLEYRDGRKELLLVALLATALWQERILAQNPDWSGALLPLLAGGTTLAALGLALVQEKDPARQLSWTRVYMAVGAMALLACPLGWSLTPVLSPSGDASVEADPTLITGAISPDAGTGPGAHGMGRQGRRPPGNNKLLLAFLMQHRSGAEYLVAAQNSQAIAPLIIASGESAVSIGGFMGRDPIVNADQFTAMVRAGKIRYFLLGRDRVRGPGGQAGASARDPWAGGAGGNDADARLIALWVRSHGRVVDSSLWQAPSIPAPDASAGPEGSFQGWDRNADLRLYDLSVLSGDGGAAQQPARKHRHWQGA